MSHGSPLPLSLDPDSRLAMLGKYMAEKSLSQEGRHCVSDLLLLEPHRSFENKGIREGLQSSSLSHRQAAVRGGMDQHILAEVADDN